jgi:hypothetical protein
MWERTGGAARFPSRTHGTNGQEWKKCLWRNFRYTALATDLLQLKKEMALENHQIRLCCSFRGFRYRLDRMDVL